jgi:hypothetical protein
VKKPIETGGKVCFEERTFPPVSGTGREKTENRETDVNFLLIFYEGLV